MMQALEDKLAADFGIVFKDKSLLETAFTHTSYANEHRLLNISHNERLEFLGDAVLQLLISRYLFAKFPKKPEGDLSKMRSMLVREESLAGFGGTSLKPFWEPWIWTKGLKWWKNSSIRS